MRGSSAFAVTCSGAMYAGVPKISPWPVVRIMSASSGARILATPKSSTLMWSTWPRRSTTIMLAGLRSRWMTPREWAWSIASASWIRIGSALATGSGPSRRSI